MENVSDAEDFVPPTPQNTKKQVSFLKNVTTQKQNSKLNQNSKRKKASGVSPEFKKFKDKTKQVSLFSYLKKENVKGLNSEADVLNSVKVNLFSKTNSSVSKLPSPVKVTNFACDSKTRNDKVKPLESYSCDKQICNEIKNLKLDFDNRSKVCDNQCVLSDCVEYNENSLQNTDDQNVIPDQSFSNDQCVLNNCATNLKHHENNLSCTDKNVVPDQSFSSNQCVLNDCSTKLKHNVKNLSCTKDKNMISDQSFLSKQCVFNDCGTNLELNENSLSCAEDKNVIPDQSFSWLDDVGWKECDSLLENGDSCLEISCSSENKSINFGSIEKNGILYKVKEVHKTAMNEVKLLLTKPNSESNKLKTCILKGFWTDSLVQPGDSVHVLKEFANNQATIDNHSGFLVVNPDFLLSSTAVVSTLFCMRKAALNHILPQWSSGNNIMMIGSLVHDIFQQAVNNHAETVEDVCSILERVLKKRDYLICLSCQDSSEEEIKHKVMEYVPSIASWIKRHCAFKGMTASENLQVTFVKAIEDNVWCPKYGIKGKIDMTVEAFFCDKGVSKTLPLELKTGRPTYSAEHKGQINLYNLMLEERSKEISDGLLLYLRDAANMKLLAADHNSRRGLIQLRNELAFYTRKWISTSCVEDGDIEDCHLPKPINNKKFCGKCSYILPCTVYQRAFSDDKHLAADHAMVSLISSSTSHLTSSHLEYFIHWSNLLLLESTSSAVTNAFWMEEATNREKKGMCISWLYLADTAKKDPGADDIFYISSFRRSTNSSVTSNLISIGLRVGDYVAVSNQNKYDEVALTMGYILQIYDDCVEVTSERDLSLIPQVKDYVFRIDKQVSSSATSCIRNNLMRLMDNESQAQNLRKFVVDKCAPTFLKSLPKNVVLLGRPIFKALNKVQQKVVLKALMAEDYFIIKGMPGTGKTSTIVALVRLLVALGLSVFLTSYTHSAIDNILLKLKEHLRFVRIGQEARIHSDLKKFSFETVTKDFTSADQFKQFMTEQRVVAATCLGISHAIFKVRKFDVCIVDEASQINQIACLGPLFHAKKFILVGDDKQLPPLVTNEKAKSNGMQESLLQRLCDAGNCMELVIQYRMNKAIMRLCNELTYGGALQCGSESIAEAVLELKPPQEDSPSTPSCVLSAFHANLQKSVVLMNTNQISTLNLEKGEGKEINNFEAELVITILKCLLARSVSEHQIGVITPYRRQVDLIESKLKNLKLNEVEVNTVDQYQGRDKDVIIISCVKCKSGSDSEHKGILLNDERRLNVAVSRAKRKLIIIGCMSTLILYAPCANLIKCLGTEQILDVPADFLSS